MDDENKNEEEEKFKEELSSWFAMKMSTGNINT
jgi:hypothetical protein